MKKISVSSAVEFGNDLPFVLIAGPCAIESYDHVMFMAERIKEMTNTLEIPFVFKASFDKANRTSIDARRGVGMHEGLEILKKVKDAFECPVITDVHAPEQCQTVADVVDILQIPAFLCRQTDLLMAAAQTKKTLNVKKGQFLAPWDMANVIKKIESFGCESLIVCERGVSFGYNTLVSDMRSLPIMAKMGYPVMFDATHSVQQPGGQGATTGGQREFAPILAKAALTTCISSVFIETHDNPDQAFSDGPNMIRLDDLEQVLFELKAIDSVSKQNTRRI